MPALFSLLKGIGIGAGAMYLFDPVAGRRRRSMLRDQAVSLSHDLQAFVDRGVRDLANRRQGLMAEMRSFVQSERVPHEVIERRVHTLMGRYVSHPRAIDVSVDDDRVVLRGPILSTEVQPFLRAVESLRGVVHVENQLDVHEKPEVPGLSEAPRRRRTPAPWPANLPPGTMLLAGTAGIGLLVACAARRNTLTAALTGAALGLMARAATETAPGGPPSGPRERHEEPTPQPDVMAAI